VTRRRLGTAGPELSPVGIGTWAMSGPYEYGWGPVDDAESVAAIREAVERGVNWIDSAALYGFGHAEEIVAKALEPYRPGEDVYVFTKCGRRWEERSGDRPRIYYDLRPESIREECEASLRRLGVERIDLYQFHWPDYGTGTPVEESWATMAALAAEGKVRWCGVSNFDVPLLERCEAIRHVDSLQPRLNLIDRHALDELIPWARANGTGVIGYSPLGSGLLSGNFDRDRLADDDWRRRAPQFQDPQLGRNLELVERLRALAERLGVGAVGAGRDRRDRRRPPAGARGRVDRGGVAGAGPRRAGRDRPGARRDRRGRDRRSDASARVTSSTASRSVAGTDMTGGQALGPGCAGRGRISVGR
jgi:aryl-alcohol dehydrogenase-like predicted oxidoreductase